MNSYPNTRRTALTIAAALVHAYDAAAGPVFTRDAGDDPRDGKRALDFQLDLSRASIDEEARTIRASLSSEAPVARFFGVEVLRHSKDAVDLARATHGLPLLFNHDPNVPLGVVRDLQVRDGRSEGVLHFAKSARALEMWEQVRDGFLTNMSIGYRVSKWDVDEDTETHTATRWSLLEASVVTVPADFAVGVGRAAASPAGAVATRDDDNTVVGFDATRRQARSEGVLEGQRIERQRIAGIRELFARERFQQPAYRALCEDLVSRGVSVEEARRELLDALGTGAVPVADVRSDTAGGGRHIIHAGADQLDKYRESAEQVLLVRGGLAREGEVVQAARSSELYGLDLVDMAREYLRRINHSTHGLDKMRTVGEAFVRFTPGHGVSDFSALLGNVATKAMLMGFERAPETWPRWCRIGRLPDFKTADRVNMSGFGGLDELPASGEYKQGGFSDLKEQIRLITYGKLFNINRQAIINDDMSAFTTVPMKMGQAANRKIGDVVYSLLISNPTLVQDSTTLFHADHANGVLSSGGQPDITTLTAAFVAMGLQRAPAPTPEELGHVLNISPRYLLCSKANEIANTNLVINEYDPAGTAGTLKRNPFMNRLEVIADPRLDADSSGAPWYLVADQNQWDTMEVAFLDGEQRPFLDQQEGWSIDGVSYKVRLDAGAAPLGFQGWYKNVGA